jgi:hypothetical protein
MCDLVKGTVWSDQIGKLLALEDAVKALCSQENVSKKLGSATDQLMHYQPTDFPEPLRPRFERLRAARVKASRHYVGGTHFDFGKNRAEHEALRQAILDLYKACLLDLGAARDRDRFEIAYPSTP